jgi:guanyl-specific ribonuclease Sa
MERTCWKVYGVLIILGWWSVGGFTSGIDSGSASEPTVPADSVPSGQSAGPARHDATPSRDQELPRAAKEPLQKAKDLLEAIRLHQGKPLPGYVGGRDFQNRERRLPKGRYREYDVNPRRQGHPRDAERIVIEQQTGKAYYSGDHYRTFVPLN